MIKAIIHCEDEYKDEYIHPEIAPINGAYEVSEWTKQIFYEPFTLVIRHKAILDDNGQPKLVTDKLPKEPNKDWFEYGKNHKQIDSNKWEREIEDKYWVIDIESLEQLEDIIISRNGELSYDDYNKEFVLRLNYKF
jgi:hypothetical protein